MKYVFFKPYAYEWGKHNSTSRPVVFMAHAISTVEEDGAGRTLVTMTNGEKWSAAMTVDEFWNGMKES